ncbi:MAG: hypothetical protein RL160_420 [Bacteroidota bacterium]|jgi:PKD repeat protein
MNKAIRKKTTWLLALLLMSAGGLRAQVNLALTGTPNHSGGGLNSTGYGPSNYNDKVIAAGVFGWVQTLGNPSTSSWHEYSWSSPQTIQRIRFYTDNTTTRTLTGGTVQVWNGSTFTNVMTFSVSPQLMFDITLPSPQTTTIIRITNHVTTGSQNTNPSLREIEVYGPNRTWDAAVTNLSMPGVCGGSRTITATVTNSGRSAWDSVRVGFSVDGTVQSNSWLVQRINSGSSANVNFTYNFTGTGAYTIKAFTSLPNNKTDTAITNDTFTLVSNVFAQPSTTKVVDQVQCGSGYPLHKAQKQTGRTIWFDKYYNPFVLAAGDSVYGKTKLYPNGTLPNYYKFDAITLNGISDTFSTSLLNTWSYAGGTSPQQKGYFFDIRTKADMLFTGFDAVISDASQAQYQVEVYYREGTATGYESTSAGWVSCGKTSITNTFNSFGVKQPTVLIDINDMYLLSGKTYGFYMVVLDAVQSLRTHCEQTTLATGNTYVDLLPGALSAVGLFSFTYTRGFRPEVRLHIEPGCASTTAATQNITVNPRPIGAESVASTPYKSSRMGTPGFRGSPDIVAHKDTISFELTPPTGYANADHGTTWTITSFTAITNNGYIIPAANYTVSNPGATANAKMWFHPTSSIIDSLVNVRITFQDLGLYNCDSTVERWIRVAPKAKPNFTFTSPTCDGQDVAFENTSTVSSGGMEYKWYFGDGDSSDAKNPVHRFKTSGTWKVKLIVTTIPYGYVTDTTIDVVVTEIPKVNFTKNNSCEGSATNFQNTTTYGGTGTVIYSWDFGDGKGTSTLRNPSYKYSSPGGYAVTLTASVNGCASSITKNTYLFHRPKASFDLPSGKNCAREAGSFTNKSTIGAGNVGSLWDFGDGDLGTVVNPVHAYATEGSYNVRLIAISEFGCADTMTKVLVIKEKPMASFVNGQVCLNKPVTFSNTSQHSSGLNPQYFWRFSDGQTSATKDASRTWNTPGPRKITLIVTPFNSCVDSVSAMVEPGILPNVNFTLENNCSGKEINIANLSDAPQGDIVYAWDFGNGNTSTERVPKPVYNITTSRTFNVTLKAQVLGGCLDSLVKTVTVFELPKCDFTINDIYKNGHRAFSFTPGVTNYSFYRWTFGDGGNSNQASTEYQYTYDGPFTVTLTARNSAGCECQSTRILNVLNLGVSDVAAAGIRVYPNPATGYLNVDLPAAAANTTVSLLDATGRLVLTEKLGAAQNKLRVEQLPAGLYQVVVTVDGVSSTTRVVVGR